MVNSPLLLVIVFLPVLFIVMLAAGMGSLLSLITLPVIDWAKVESVVRESNIIKMCFMLAGLRPPPAPLKGEGEVRL